MRLGQLNPFAWLTNLKFRHKLLIPGALAAVATLVAMAITWRISQSAAAELSRVETRHVPAVLLAQDLEVRLGAVARQLQEAELGAADALSTADDMKQQIVVVLDSSDAEVLAEDRRAVLKEELDAWYALAREAVAARAKGRGASPDPATVTLLNAARVRLQDDLAVETSFARSEAQLGFESARELQRRSVLVGSAILLLAALASGALAWFVSRGLSRPIERLQTAAARIAAGDLTIDLTVDSKDEVGALAESFLRMTERLRAIVTALRDSAAELSSAGVVLSTSTRSQTQMLEQQAKGIAQAEATIRELEQAASVAASRATAVLDVARRAAEFSESGRTSASQSEAGLRSLREAVDAIVGQSTKLLEHAQQVGGIVATARDLASQSHVLSLNASIEAARAGEAGRGFAVVAAEVRSLAEQSGQGAVTIGKIVNDILHAIRSTLTISEQGT
ncbi:MAG TPA: methyl-accepting chemotaxis protein, partial [Anaeromyxobacteraceae bacterium]|nr:methyl-accepting chemotaxis protein [Anaeromyxobacteraceae bacterium]